MIEIRNLVKKYKNEDKILYKNFIFNDGKSYILLGASGCGKSTLLNMICSVLNVDEGEVIINGKVMNKLTQKEKDNFRIKKIGYIYQDFKLLNNMTVMDNIEILKLEGIDTSICNQLLDKLGILNKKNKKICDLSGGEKQRVAIARAIVKKPDIILADEPTGNLNFEIGEQVIKELLEISKGKTLIVVSHDERLTKYFDCVVNMDDLIVKEGDFNA